MNESSDLRRLTTQEDPAGRVELTANRSYLQDYRRRWTRDGDISELFHENTKFDEQYLRRLTLTNDLLPDGVSVVTSDYHSQPAVALPEPGSLDVSLDSVLANRRSTRTFADEAITASQLGTLLGHAIGPTDHEQTAGLTELFRPYPSAGGTVPVEVYPVVTNGANLDSGAYYYTPREHALRQLNVRFDTEDQADVAADIDTDTEFASAFAHTFMEGDSARDIVADAAVTIVLTGSFGRIKAKYGPVGYRFALFEAGHLAQNLLLVAQALGMGGVPVGGFLDDTLDQSLGLDGVNESVLYPIVMGHRGGS